MNDVKPIGESTRDRLRVSFGVVAAGLTLIAITGCSPDSPAPLPQATPEVRQALSVPQPAVRSVEQQRIGEPPKAIPIATPPGRYSFAFNDTSLKFVATLPDGPPNDPVLSALRRDADTAFADRKSHARKVYEGMMSGPDAVHFSAMDDSITWRYTAKAAGVVSLVGLSKQWEGQSHPEWGMLTHTARVDGTVLKFEDMLSSERPLELMATLCEALRVDKRAKGQGDFFYNEPIVCENAELASSYMGRARFALAPSTTADKFGGVYAYYGPYDLGGYNEGSYQFAADQHVFAGDLKPEFRPLFAGRVSSPPPDPF